MMSWLSSQLLPFTLLLASILVLRPLTLRKLGARWQYCLWGAVPLSLLCSQLPLATLFASESPWYRLQVNAHKLSMDLLKDTEISSIWAPIWLFGVAVMLLCILTQYWHLSQQLQAAALIQLTPAQPYPTQHQAPWLSLRCKQSTADQGPWVCGLLTPTVLLPRDFQQRFSPLQQQLILKHEYTHWQRGDLHCNLLALLLLTLFWFHPLSWLAYRAYRQDQELSCDALVLQQGSSEQQIAYSYALLSNAQQRTAHWQVLTNHYGDKQMIKQRLMQLRQQQGFSKTSMTVTLAALLGMALWLQQPVQAAGAVVEPTKRIEPRYPVQAAQQKIEGYVVAEFDIKPDGTVENIKVIKAVPEQTFEKESVRALQQWTYNPSSAGMKNVQVRLDFMMDPVPKDQERLEVTHHN